MFVIRDFKKHYGDHLALSVDHLQFAPGVYWIKGENGSGKTTFFRSLAGLLPCRGSVGFDDGVSLHDHPVAYRQRVNYSEAEPVFPGFLTAKDLFEFIGEAKGASAAQRAELRSAFGIDAYYDHAIETYSSGMLKKLSLAMAFFGSPRLIILDEPLITLDEKARTILQARISERVAQQRVTFLISSHQALSAHDVPVVATYTVQNQTIGMA